MSRPIRFGRVVFRFNWLIAACVLLIIAGLVRLGIWQLSRAQEKIDLQSSYQSLGQQEATPIDYVPVAGLEFDRLQHQNRRVSLRGSFLNNRNIFLIYQTYEGQLGFEVVTPFAVEDSHLIVMVSRGWAGVGSAEELAAGLPPVTGELEVQGQLYVPTEEQAARGNDLAPEEVDWPLTIRYLNTRELAAYFEQPLFPYAVRLAEEQPGILVRHWPEVMVDTGRNFSYALQWFAMAIAVLIVSLILSSNLLTLRQKGSKGSKPL